MELRMVLPSDGSSPGTLGTWNSRDTTGARSSWAEFEDEQFRWTKSVKKNAQQEIRTNKVGNCVPMKSTYS